jgi:hypothetical protein
MWSEEFLKPNPTNKFELSLAILLELIRIQTKVTY